MDKPVVTLSEEMVKDYLPLDELITTVEKGLSDFSKGPQEGVNQPVRTVIGVNRPGSSHHHGFFGVMPAFSSTAGALACKIVSFFPENAEHNKKTHLANVMLYDPEYGELKAIMGGEYITAMRTAAASAVATKHLLEDCRRPLKLALIGAGVQARSHHQALRLVANISQVSIWSRTDENAHKCAEEINATACQSVEEAVADADIIVTATFAQTPVLKKGWVKVGAHINAVGACTPGWQEIDPELMTSSVVYVDSRDAAQKEAGDIILSGAEIYAEIGEVINKSVEVKRTPVTVFKSLGLGIEDAVSAKLVYDKYTAIHP